MDQKLVNKFSVIFGIMHFVGSFLLWVYLVGSALQNAEINNIVKVVFCLSYLMWFPVTLLAITRIVSLNSSTLLILILINSILWANLLNRFLIRREKQ